MGRSSASLAIVSLISALAACSDSGSASPADAAPDGPHAATVRINEFLANPAAVSDGDGEWLELYNPGQASVDLAGWTLKDDGANLVQLQGPLELQPGGYLVLGLNPDPSQNGGVSLDVTLQQFYLANAQDQIVLLDASGQQVDRVAYDATWPLHEGVATALRQPTLAGDDAQSWCLGASAWSGSAGDRGSPGAANSCGAAPPPVDAGPYPDGLPYMEHSISFKADLCPYIAAGSKAITLRNGHWSWVVAGEWVTLSCTGTGTSFKARLTLVRHTTYGGITSKEWSDDGFKSQAEMLQTMQQYYPGITVNDPATVIRWDSLEQLP